MATSVPRHRKSGIFWFMRDDDGHEHKCGAGKNGKKIARRWADSYNETKVLSKAGQLPERPTACLWTLEDLHKADIQDAKDRGLRTARPQFQGKASKRESHWKNLLAFFGAQTPLDLITQTEVKNYIAERQKKVGNVPINRDLWGVLRPALRLARETDAAGYTGDPFRKLRKLDETAGAREPVALTKKDAAERLKRSYELDPVFGAWVDLQLLTASRPGQTGVVKHGLFHYEPHKRGIARDFPLKGRLKALARKRRVFSPTLWGIAWEGVRPHDLRHTALTWEGRRPGASLESIRILAGWKSVAMADRYLHHGKKTARTVTPR